MQYQEVCTVSSFVLLLTFMGHNMVYKCCGTATLASGLRIVALICHVLVKTTVIQLNLKCTLLIIGVL